MGEEETQSPNLDEGRLMVTSGTGYVKYSRHQDPRWDIDESLEHQWDLIDSVLEEKEAIHNLTTKGTPQHIRAERMLEAEWRVENTRMVRMGLLGHAVGNGKRDRARKEKRYGRRNGHSATPVDGTGEEMA